MPGLTDLDPSRETLARSTRHDWVRAAGRGGAEQQSGK